MENRRRQLLYQQVIDDAKNRFNPEINLVSSGSMGEPEGSCFRPAGSLGFAQALLVENTPDSVKTACSILSAVLDSQELNSQRPHYGNFTWLAGDSEVGDLNAVQFVLRGLLPILIKHDHQLPEELAARCRFSLELALEEEIRLDVSLLYTNIHLMSLFSLLAGGQWLDNTRYRDIGRNRWDKFAAFTVKSGAPHEYNSSNYGAVDLSTLAVQQSLIHDEEVCLQAKLLYERFWLHIGLHIHYPTSQLAGPHSRAYWMPMTTGYSMLSDLIWYLTGRDEFVRLADNGLPEMESLYALEMLLTEHNPPDYLFPWLEKQVDSMPYEVIETTNAHQGDTITTYFSPSFALGTAAQTYGIGTDCFYIEHQANYMSLHYKRSGEKKPWGMVYSRFVINDRYWNTISAASDRPANANFYEQGNFAGVQLKNKTIGLYTLMPQNEEVFSIKTVIVFSSGKDLKRILINDKEILWNQLPYSLNDDDWIVVEDGDVLIGVRILKFSLLGPGTGITLEKGTSGELWITVSNYCGIPKRFWEYASLKGAFWRGNIKAGFIMEVTEAADYACTEDFMNDLQLSRIQDSVNEQNIRSITFHRKNENIRLDYDLLETSAAGRWRNNQEITLDGLQSPLAVQGASGFLKIGETTLSTKEQPVMLIVHDSLPGKRSWIAVNPENKPTHLVLITPNGKLEASRWGMGRIEWRVLTSGAQEIHISGLEKPENLSVPDNIKVYFQDNLIG
ncbi:MAG: hypothetical protein HQ557_03465 [Bacteroidetes bacterium]|nr:hypothetical protein [Bacteroidota bacterium]